MNDTTLLTSLEGYQTKTNYFLRNDTLFIKDAYILTDATHKGKHVEWWDGYKILDKNKDSLKIINTFKGFNKPDDWEDTLELTSLQFLKEEIKDFKYLKLTYLTAFGKGFKISIDSVKNVLYESYPEIKIKGKIATRKKIKCQLLSLVIL